MEQKDSYTKDDKLDALFLSVAESIHGEPPMFIWPAPHSTPAECEFYLGDDFLASFYDDIAQLRQKGYRLEAVAEMLQKPSRIAQTIWPFGHVVSVDDEFRKQLIELASTIVDLISCFRIDPFNRSGKNIIWSKDKLGQFLPDNPVIGGDDPVFAQFKPVIAKLEGTLWLYSELLYFSIHEACKEFHGPYALPNGKLALVREYYDLRPSFWLFTDEMPFRNILVFEVYSQNTDIMFDFFGRLRSKQTLIHDLEGFSILVDGSSVSTLKELTQIYEAMLQISHKGARHAGSLSRVEVMNKFIEAYYYILKPLKDTLGKNWAPPKKILDDVENACKEELIQKTYGKFREMSKLQPSEQLQILSKSFDPRFR